jgi:hypothetical protein
MALCVTAVWTPSQKLQGKGMVSVVIVEAREV